jgi:hypothetical protein
MLPLSNKVKGHNLKFDGESVDYFEKSQSINHFPVGLYFNKKYGTAPCTLDLNNKYKKEILEYLVKNGELIYEYTSIPSKTPEMSTIVEGIYYDDMSDSATNKLFTYKDNLVYIQKSHSKKFKSDDLCFEITIYYAPGAECYYNDFNKFVLEEDVKNIIYTIMRDEHGSVRFDPFEVNIPDGYNIDECYEPEFKPMHKHIVDSLNKNESGLYLFHGDPGTGKTTYIKYISSLVKREMIYVPTSFIEHLADPSFLPALLHKKESVLIIEDAEKALLAREPGDSHSSSLVSSILNITDGIMANVFNIAIIATYNSPRQSIDKALLRKGRLKAEYRFDKLSIETAQKIMNNVNPDYTVTEPMALADIYNTDTPDEFVAKDLKEEKRMGFR